MRDLGRNLLCWFGMVILLGGQVGLQAQTESFTDSIAVDHHVHLLSETLIADWKSLGMPFGKENPHYCDPETVLKNVGAKQAFAISMAHLYTSEWFARLDKISEREAELVRAENDFIADCVARHPDRLVGFFSIHPLRDYSRQEMDRCLKEKSFRGIKLHLPACGIDLIDEKHLEALSDVFQWSLENKVGILIHCFSGNETVAQVERFWKLVEKHSGLTIIIAHNGTSGGYSDVSQLMLSGFLDLKTKGGFDSSKVFFDLSGAVLAEETDGMPATTDEHCQRLAEMMPKVGWDRFLYASDYPVFTRDQMKTLLHVKLKLEPDSLAQVMGNRVQLDGLELPTDMPGWHQFRGPHGLGSDSSGVRFPDRLDVERDLKWKVPAARGHSSPIVVRESVILTGHADDQLITQCFRLQDGSLRWQKNLPVSNLEKSYHHGPATPTAVSDGQNIYCVFGSLGVFAYDLAGNELWRKEMEPADNLYGTAASPILMGNRLLVFLSDQTESRLLALDKTTGQEIWNRKAAGPASSWSTPAGWPKDNPQLILIYEPFHLRAISIADGTELWSIPGLADEPIAIPQVNADLVLVTSYNMRTNEEVLGPPTFAEILKECDSNGDGTISPEESKRNKSVLSRPDADGEGDHPLHSFFRMLDENRDLQIEAKEWPRLQSWVDSFKHANGFIGLRIVDAKSAPEMLWQAETGVPECPTSLIVKDKLFAVRNGGVVTFLNLADGKTLFRKRIAPGGPYYASPTLGDGKIFLASARGELSILSAAIPFDLLSKVDLKEPIWATPALAVQSRQSNSAADADEATQSPKSPEPKQPGVLIVRSENHLWLFQN